MYEIILSAGKARVPAAVVLQAGIDPEVQR